MRFVALHYHIFKNAGSTIESLFERSFGPGLGRFESADRGGQLSSDQLLSYLEAHPELKAVSSHQLRYPKPHAPGYVFFDVCFLRDPIDRIGSMYSYFRKGVSDDDPLCRLAHENSLGAFVARLIAGYPHMVNNVQVNMLATDGAYCRPPGRHDLERALQTLHDMSFPGVVDCFDQSVMAGQYYWRPIFPEFQIAACPANVSSHHGSTLQQRLHGLRQSCERRVFRELVALNELDLELLRQARREVHRRERLVPEHELRMRQLREGQQRLGPGEDHRLPELSLAQRCVERATKVFHALRRLPD